MQKMEVENMKLCKANYEETKNVMVESINRFIDYINEYCSKYAWLNDDMEKYAEESKGRVEEFIAEHNIDMKECVSILLSNQLLAQQCLSH